MTIDRGSETTVQLLTLLNVSATRAGKRKWTGDEPKPAPKLNKRRAVQFDDAPEPEPSSLNDHEVSEVNETSNEKDVEDEEMIVLGEDGADDEGTF